MLLLGEVSPLPLQFRKTSSYTCTLFCLILSLDFSKGVMGRLVRRAVVAWWFIKGLSSSILIYISILLLINLQNHYYCPSLQMWRPEGFLALQGVTAPPCGLFFRHFYAYLYG